MANPCIIREICDFINFISQISIFLRRTSVFHKFHFFTIITHMKITYLAKLGELTLKGSNKNAFESKLVRNTRDFLKHIPVDVILRAGRMYIEVEEEYCSKVEFCLNHLIGITGWAKTTICEKTIEAITETVTKLGKIAKENGAKTFKLDARRSDKSFPLDSYGIMREAAAGLYDDKTMTVDVHNPDVTIFIEVREKCFVYTDSNIGCRGLPVGTSGKGLLLLSGGLDSPVAGYRMLRRGMKIECIYFHSYPYTSEEAQKKVEDRNFEIRKHLLDYDDVLNEQRTVIYNQRDQILADKDLSKRVMSNATETVEMLFDEYEDAAKHNKNSTQPLSDLAESIHQTFGFQLPTDKITKEAVLAYLQNDITEKETLAGKENFNMFIRYQYIQIIDKKWLDQLETLEGLREAVALRSYGSKNPLTEYKIDGFNIFDEMLDSIRTTVMSRVFKVRVQLSPEAAEQRRRMAEAANQGMNAQHNESQSFGAQVANNEAQRSAASNFNGDMARRQAVNSAMNQRSQGDSVTVRRTMPKVGRNDPCPCGSGKKYKQCCGR